MGLRITTWNVNGIRNPFSYEPWNDKRTFDAMFDILGADIVILQETKIQRKDLRDDMVLVPGWDCYFSLPRQEKGKFGVVIYTRQSACAPIRAEEGISGVLCPPNSSTAFKDILPDEQIGGYPSVDQAEAALEALVKRHPKVAAEVAPTLLAQRAPEELAKKAPEKLAVIDPEQLKEIDLDTFAETPAAKQAAKKLAKDVPEKLAAIDPDIFEKVDLDALTKTSAVDQAARKSAEEALESWAAANPDVFKEIGPDTIAKTTAAQNFSDPSEIFTNFKSLDWEGRCILLEFPAFVLIGVYCPATRSEARSAFKIAFTNLLDIRIRNLVALGKRVILAGDLNIIKSPIDMANAEVDLRKGGTDIEKYFSQPTRLVLNQLLDNGEFYDERDVGRRKPILSDVCRAFHPIRKGMFTCWETKIHARPGNYGSRIDYILCSMDMLSWFDSSDIQEGLMGSDHCPVFADMKDVVLYKGALVNIRDIMNPPGMFSDGQRLRDYSSRDVLPFSGRLLPEFTKRMSIRDMFSKKMAQPSPSPLVEAGKGPVVPPNDGDNPHLGTPAHSSPLSQGKEDNKIHSTVSSSPTKQSKAAPPKGVKRESSGKATPTPTSKRTKSGSSSVQASSQEKGQQSLKGFFKPKASTIGPPDSGPSHVGKENAVKPEAYTGIGSQLDTSSASTPVSSKETVQSTASPPGNEVLSQKAPSESTGTSSQPTLDDGLESLDFDQAAKDTAKSIQSWSKLFTKPIAPRCESHNEPCKIMVTKKPGVNCGRSFWMCSKPLGPSGMKEHRTEWRCRTFIWCSEWRESQFSSGDQGGEQDCRGSS